MMNKTIAIIVLALATQIFAAPESKAAEAEVNLQCIGQCIMTEGDSDEARNTCKYRCSGIDPLKPTSGADCGVVYKQCIRACEDVGACKSACREAKQDCI